LKNKIQTHAGLVEGKRIMVFRVGSFVPGVKIVQSYKSRKIKDAAILLVFLVMFEKIFEFDQFVEELTGTQNLKG
jgi:hypothetical protein